MKRKKDIAFWISIGNLYGLIENSALYGKSVDEILSTLVHAGFVGVAGLPHELNAKLLDQYNLEYACGIAFTDLKRGMEDVRRAESLGGSSITIHLGNGLNSDSEIFTWLDAIYNLKTSTPLYIETHRGTVTQDIFRTLQLLKRYPDMRLTGDFSHWYTGLLLGQDFKNKIDTLRPVFERTDILHGRLATDTCIQVPIDEMSINALDHFNEMWCSVLRLSESNADTILFIIELLPAAIGYGNGVHHADGRITDATDRWNDALQLKELMTHRLQQQSIVTIL